MEEKNIQQQVDVAIIKVKVDKIEKWIDNADVNHFPTIERRFDALDKKIAGWSAVIVVAGAIIQLALSKIF